VLLTCWSLLISGAKGMNKELKELLLHFENLAN
jgi:hypothetical protein